MLPYSSSMNKSVRSRSRGRIGSGPVSPLSSNLLFEDKSAFGVSMGVDMSLILAPTGGYEKDEKRIKSVAFQLNEEGKAVGTPLDVVVFSDQLKKTITRDIKNPVYEEIHNENHPWIAKTDARYLQGRYAGYCPISSQFHEMSSREREGSEDEGDDSDAEDSSKFVVTKSQLKRGKRKPRDYNRKSVLYESINKIGMVKGEFAFPRRTYMPKSLIPYVVADNQVPKAVVVERLSRAYRAVDINLVLQNLGVMPSDIIPPARYGETNEKFYHEKMYRNRAKIEGIDKVEYIHREGRLDEHLMKVQMFSLRRVDVSPSPATSEASSKIGLTKAGEKLNKKDSESDETLAGSRANKQQFLKSRPPFDPMFPLNYFDNEDFDVRSGIEWLALGWDPEEKKNYAIPGKAYLPFPKPENSKNLPTLATKTNKILLSKTEKLEGLRKVLMKERYGRMLQNAGLTPTHNVESSSTKMELAMLAKVISHIPSIMKTPSQKAIVNSRKSIFVRRFSSVDAGIAGLLDEVQSSDSDEDLMIQMGESYAGLQSDLLELKIEFERSCYTKHPEIEDDPGHQKSMMIYPGTGTENSETDLDRSESLLSEVFSQLGSLTSLPTDVVDVVDVVILKSQDEKTENDVSDISVSVSEYNSGDSTPRRPLPVKAKFIRKKSSEEKTSEKQNRSVDEAPDSPDEDAYSSADAADNLIMDYGKMKKPYNYDWRWVDVAVVDYDLEDHKYLVCSTTSKQQIFAWVGKPYLCFDGEDPYVQGERIKDAVLRRYDYEHTMRYNLYIDCLPVADAPIASEDEVEKIVNKIRWSSKTKLSEKLLRKISMEQDLIYQRVHTKLRFEKLLERMPHVFKPWVQKPCSDLNLDEYNFNTDQNMWASRKHRFNLSRHGFNYRAFQLQRKMFWSSPQTSEALAIIMKCCDEAKKKSFIVMNLEDHVHLDEYEKLQADHVSELIQYLKNEWYETILATIRSELNKSGNSSTFNLQEQDYQLYRMSRLPAFLRLINFIMEATVKAMLLNSFQAYNKYIKDLTVGCKAKKFYDWGNDLSTSKFILPKGMSPLFILELKMEKDGPKYTQLLSKYLNTPSRIFSMCIKSIKRFPQLRSILMPNFHGNEKNTLNIMEEDDPAVITLKLQAQNYLKSPLLLLDSYAQKFKRYLSMWNMDEQPHPFIQSRDEIRLTTVDLRKILDQHYNDIQKIETEIAEELVVSAFVANTGLVKHALIKKKKTACNLLLERYAEKLKASVLKIMHRYAECERKLSIRSDEIKEVMYLRDYAETVPGFIADCVTHMNKIIKDYEIFEEYNHTLHDEDVENKWGTAIQSHRLVHLTAAAIDLLEDDYERLLKIQQQDLISLSDQIDSATMTIIGLNAYTDLDRAADAVIEVRKVWQMVKDLEALIHMLNSRQLIFKQPVTQTESLKRLLYDIEPYKNLWFTAAECLHVRDSIMKDTLDKIDVGNLAKSVHDGLMVMDHCIEYFNDAPSIQHIAMEVKHLTLTYEPILPVVEAFKTPAMKSRHWDEISKICGYPVYPKANEPFKRLLDLDILQHSHAIIEIANKAKKETEIVIAIDKMELHVKEYSIRLGTDESTGIQIIQLPESALETVLICLNDTDLLVASPYKALHEERLTTWWKKIHELKENMELWFNLQDEWLNMQSHLPLIKTLTRTPNVFRIYKMVVRVWRRLLRLAKESELMEEAAVNNTVFASLTQLKGLLGKIKDGLEEYAKRGTEDDDKSDSDY